MIGSGVTIARHTTPMTMMLFDLLKLVESFANFSQNLKDDDLLIDTLLLGCRDVAPHEPEQHLDHLRVEAIVFFQLEKLQEEIAADTLGSHDIGIFDSRVEGLLESDHDFRMFLRQHEQSSDVFSLFVRHGLDLSVN